MRDRLGYFTTIPVDEHTREAFRALEELLQSQHGSDGRHPIATASQDGFLSAEDKLKLDKVFSTVFPSQVVTGGTIPSGGGGGGGGGTTVTVIDYSVKMEFDVNNNPIYIGKANPGTLSSAAGWQIRKIGYDSLGDPISILWANGSSAFSNIWDNRGSLSYS